MGKSARHNYRAPDFLALIAFMVKKLGWDDKKIASTLGLQLRYFQYIVIMIPELSETMEKAREEVINEVRQKRKERMERNTNPDLL